MKQDNFIIILVILIVIYIGLISAMDVSIINDIDHKLDIINNKYDKMIHAAERLQMYNKSIHNITKTSGLYFDNQLFCAWVKDKSPNDIYVTVSHELAHHNISLSKKLISTSDFIEMDMAHFCNHSKQTEYKINTKQKK